MNTQRLAVRVIASSTSRTEAQPDSSVSMLTVRTGQSWISSSWLGQVSLTITAPENAAYAGVLDMSVGRRYRHLVPSSSLIRAQREHAKLSVQQAGELVYVSGRTWARYESGELTMPPGLWQLFLIRSIDEFFRRRVAAGAGMSGHHSGS